MLSASLPQLPSASVPRPPDEAERLRAVDRSGLHGAPPEAALDGLVGLAARLCGVESAEINLVGDEHLWFVAARGLGTPGVAVDREDTFCTWTILDRDRPLVVHDARTDERFSANPFVLDGTIRSYAGFPLLADGQPIGTMCAHAPVPGHFDAGALDALRALAVAAQAQLELRRHVDELTVLARTDPLTGTANRRALQEALERELARAGRTGAPVALALLDLDRFKAYNDTFGHQAGDLLLQRAATAWRQELRAGDLLARWGGEEFCVLLADCLPDAAGAVADRLRAAMPEGQTCSVGVARWDGRESPEALVGRADEALYAAKRDGRDRTVVAG